MQAINLENEKLKFKVKKVAVSFKAIGWEWFLIDYDKENDIWECFVQSPMEPAGEFGSVFGEELKSINCIFESPENSLAPAGYRWA